MSLGWIESRIAACEQRLEKILRQIEDLYAKITAAAQAARTASQQYGGGGGGAGAYYCEPSGSVAGATGTWPALTAAAFTADVYAGSGDSLVLVKAGAQCYNFNRSPLVAGKVTDLVPDGQGNFDAYTQSCT